MAIVINLDVVLAQRKMRLTELSDRVGITLANLSNLKTGKARAVRFSTLEAICVALDCQPGDLIEHRPDLADAVEAPLGSEESGKHETGHHSVTAPSAVQRAYSLLAERYIDLFGSVQHVHADDLALIARHLGQVSGPVLDLGCGPGHLTGFLRSMHADVTGIDLVPEFISHARQAHPTARFEVGSMSDLDRPDGSVAGALAWFSLIHLEPGQVDGALAAIRRIMAPGASLVVGFFDGDECEPFDHKVVTAYRWPADEVSARLARTGFTEVERQHRAREGERRPYVALAVRATEGRRPH